MASPPMTRSTKLRQGIERTVSMILPDLDFNPTELTGWATTRFFRKLGPVNYDSIKYGKSTDARRIKGQSTIKGIRIDQLSLDFYPCFVIVTFPFCLKEPEK